MRDDFLAVLANRALQPLRTQARADVVARYSLAQGDAAYRALLMAP